jgi:RND family efflux transporter MFP subunit
MIARLFIGSLVIVLITSCKSGRESTLVIQAPLTEAVYASGTVQPMNAYYVFSTVSGIIVSKPVSEGDTVREGQPVLILDSKQMDIQLASTATQLIDARNNLRSDGSILSEIQQNIETAQEKFRLDSIQYHRVKALYDMQAISKQQLDQATFQFYASKNQLHQAHEKYQSTFNKLKLEYENTEKRFELMTSQKGDFVIRSQINGKVYQCYKKSGELVLPQQPLMLIGDRNNFQIDVLIDESDINRVKVRQPVLIKLDNYGEQIFKGRITRIYPNLDPQTRSFKAEAHFDQPPGQLFSGVSAEINIIVSTKEKANILPRKFILPGDSVLVINQQGQLTTKKIQTGIRNLEYVEILDGIAPNEPVYLP